MNNSHGRVVRILNVTQKTLTMTQLGIL